MKKTFTQREHDVFELVLKGYSNIEIAKKLFITIYTVKAHIASMLRKIDGKNRIDLIIYGIKNGDLKMVEN